MYLAGIRDAFVMQGYEQGRPSYLRYLGSNQNPSERKVIVGGHLMLEVPRTSLIGFADRACILKHADSSKLIGHSLPKPHKQSQLHFADPGAMSITVLYFVRLPRDPKQDATMNCPTRPAVHSNMISPMYC
jgi:hypothetical protein